MKKLTMKFCVVFISICLMIGLTVSVSADSVASGTWRNLTWELNEVTGHLVISGNGTMYPFFSASAWLPYRLSIKTITIEEGVTSISFAAFDNCSSLSSIEIPSSVTCIDERAFDNCSGLTSVFISDISAWCEIDFGVYSSNPLRYAKNFYINGTLVTNLVIPEGVTSIKDRTFANYASLTSIEIPSSVTNIGSSAFHNCTSLTSIEIPSSVTSIGSSAFDNCTSLTNVKLSSSMTSISDWTFVNCTGLASIEIPASVTSIGSYAFRNTGLTSIKIPSSVTSIGSCAFEKCTSLTSIEIPSSVTSIGSAAFYGCNLKTARYMGTQEIWKNVDVGSSNQSLLSILQFNGRSENNSENNPSDTDMTTDSYIDNVADKRDYAAIGIVIGGVAVSGIGGASVWWFAIKKKKFSDLVRLLKRTPKV